MSTLVSGKNWLHDNFSQEIRHQRCLSLNHRSGVRLVHLGLGRRTSFQPQWGRRGDCGGSGCGSVLAQQPLSQLVPFRRTFPRLKRTSAKRTRSQDFNAASADQAVANGAREHFFGLLEAHGTLPRLPFHFDGGSWGRGLRGPRVHGDEEGGGELFEFVDVGSQSCDDGLVAIVGVGLQTLHALVVVRPDGDVVEITGVFVRLDLAWNGANHDI